jgi:hypothetical protein
MFMRWRRAKEAQEGTKAILWMVVSLIVTALGLTGLLGVFCGGT